MDQQSQQLAALTQQLLMALLQAQQQRQQQQQSKQQQQQGVPASTVALLASLCDRHRMAVTSLMMATAPFSLPGGWCCCMHVDTRATSTSSSTSTGAVL